MSPEEKARQIISSPAMDAYCVATRLGHESEVRALIAQAIREAKAEAYEEAAGIAHEVLRKCGGYHDGVCPAVSTAIRDLRDSLVQSVPTFEPEKPIDVLGKPPDSYSS